MKKQFVHSVLIAVAVFGAACVGSGNEPEQPVYDGEVTVSVRMDDGTRLKSGSMPDPGQGPDESSSEWHTIGIYLAYTNGRVLSYELAKEEYEQKNHQVAFSAYEGTLTVYAVAFGGEQTFKEVKSVDELKALATLSLQDVKDSERKVYMQSLFSGKSGESVIVTAPEGTTPSSHRIEVTLYRLLAKIDVQYDVQDAYEDGGYTKAVMSQITCRGCGQGYFFPDEAGSLLTGASLDYEQSSGSAAVSERNGRAAFFVFPGMKNELEFTVDYETTAENPVLAGEKRYKASFRQSLGQNTWHYVQFNVKGSHTDTNIEL